jgi:uncharacterized tellurite resistance protein B-like protein
MSGMPGRVDFFCRPAVSSSRQDWQALFLMGFFWMFKSLQRYFETYLAGDGARPERAGEEHAKLAVAALLVEIADADFAQSPKERDEIINTVQTHFDLTEAQAESLTAQAESAHAASTDYFQFTRLINQHYSAEDKRSLVEALWRVAFADGTLHDYEEHVIRRLAELIHVPHSEFILAKHRVMKGV